MDQVMQAAPIIERFRLKGKVALVTGAGQGIGRAFAHALGEAGAAVAVVDIAADGIRQVVEELKGKGVDALAVRADVTDRDQVERMVDTVVKKWGTLTIGVNNAGIGQWVDAEKITGDIWRTVMSLNLDAVLACSQAEAREMKKAGYGKIINTASMSGHIVNMPEPSPVQRVEGRGHPPDAEPRGRMGAIRHSRELHQPGLHEDRPCREPDRDSRGEENDGSLDAAHTDAPHGGGH